ncbi:MAG: GTPase SAR1 family protein [Candidatus Nanohaloarchaea archaeon]|jgi:GTPase SAR1 family protein
MNQLGDLIDYLEENTRSSSNAGLEFIDPRNYRNRLVNEQNHAVFGRRGSGKTTLMNSFNEENTDIVKIKVNLEDYKDFSFPNVLIKVLQAFLREIKRDLYDYAGWNPRKRWEIRKVISEIDRELENLEGQFMESDEYEEQIIETSEKTDSSTVGSETSGVKFGLKSSETLEKERKRNIEKSKVVKRKIGSFKDIINSTSDILDNSIFLMLDDFYFVKRQDQPFVADFFHLLSKDTRLFLKIASIRHRTDLYTNAKESYYGIELSHDAQKIDLDYTLDRFDDMKDFMKELLRQAFDNTETELDINEIITDNGFNQLCLAAGGVPRDFLSIFIDVANGWEGTDGKRISKPDVTESALRNFSSKKDSFKKDSADEKEELELYLNYIERKIVEEKRKNMFLVSNERIDDYPLIDQAIKELMDLRMIHLVDSNTSSAPSDGTMYSAYMVDIGLYPNSRPRNFDQIDPGVRDEQYRRDNIRAAPKINLQEMRSHISEKLEKQRP